jgi:hypothetical protein
MWLPEAPPRPSPNQLFTLQLTVALVAFVALLVVVWYPCTPLIVEAVASPHLVE